MGEVLAAGPGPKIFLTGPVQAGKSTVIERVLKRVPYTVGGIRTKRIPAGPERSTYRLTDVLSGESVEFARSGPGGTDVYSSVFDTAGVRAIRRAVEGADLVLLDELGRMELRAARFQEQVFAVLRGGRRVLGVVKAEANPFLDAVRAAQGVEVLEVTLDNRDALVDVVVGKISVGGPPSPG